MIEGEPLMMRHWKTASCVLLALLVLVILVSPAVASWPTVLRCVQAAQIAFFAIMIAGTHLVGPVAIGPSVWREKTPTRRLRRSSSPDLVDLTTARLC